MTNDAELLRQYVEHGSEPAFTELVTRHVNLVYSAALRQVGGDSHLAQDVAQGAFLALARKAGSLPEGVVLGGWLYRHTSFVARQTVRAERRRRAREEKAATMNPPDEGRDANWEQLAPILDEAMGRLGREERDAVVLRFFEGRDLRAVGTALGTSEDAAKKRVSRAVEKLRSFFGRRGVKVSASVLGGLLAGNAVIAAPTGLASVMSSGALAGAAAAASGTGIGIAIWKVVAMTTKLKTGIATGLMIAGLGVTVTMQYQATRQLREENLALRRQSAEADKLRTENAQLNDSLAAANKKDVSAESNRLELLRLRGQVSGLKRQLSDAAARARGSGGGKQAMMAGAGDQAPAEAENEAAEEQKQLAFAKMNFTKRWMMAFMLYSQEHNDQFPTGFDAAAGHLPDTQGDGKLPSVSTDQFEMVYQGSITNVAKPASTIVIREREPYRTPDGGWVKAYGFADGHSEIHKADDGNFTAWEQEHMQKPGGQNAGAAGATGTAGGNSAPDGGGN